MELEDRLMERREKKTDSRRRLQTNLLNLESSFPHQPPTGELCGSAPMAQSEFPTSNPEAAKTEATKQTRKHTHTHTYALTHAHTHTCTHTHSLSAFHLI